MHNLTVTKFRTAELHTYHRNPRQGDVKFIAESLKVNGQYRPIVVNRGTHTGRPNEVLCGNHTLIGARDLSWEHIDGVTVDVDDDQAARIVAADNRTADLGSYDDRLLLELLEDLPDLDGTGYEPGDIDDLIAALEESETDTLAANQRKAKGIDDRAEGYETSESRLVVLSYEGDRYVWVVEQLGELARKFGVESNADAVLKLIEDATGETPPDA